MTPRNTFRCFSVPEEPLQCGRDVPSEVPAVSAEEWKGKETDAFPSNCYSKETSSRGRLCPRREPQTLEDIGCFKPSGDPVSALGNLFELLSCLRTLRVLVFLSETLSVYRLGSHSSQMSSECSNHY